MKSGSKKCHSCGTMTQTPYKYTIVPAKTHGTIPVYNKAAAKERPNRETLKGKMKETVNYYCDEGCYEKTPPQVSTNQYAI